MSPNKCWTHSSDDSICIWKMYSNYLSLSVSRFLMNGADSEREKIDFHYQSILVFDSQLLNHILLLISSLDDRIKLLLHLFWCASSSSILVVYVYMVVVCVCYWFHFGFLTQRCICYPIIFTSNQPMLWHRKHSATLTRAINSREYKQRECKECE